MLSGLLFGAIPVLRYAPSRQPVPLLGAMRTASASRERQRGRNLLVVAQVAMALVLLISAVLMIRTFTAMRNVDPGFSDPRIAAGHAHLDSGDAGARSADSRADAEQHSRQAGRDSRSFFRRLRRSVPMSGAEPNWDEISIEGKTYEDEVPPMRLFNYVSPGYFHTAGTRFVAGRDFTWTEIYGLRPVGIVSESLARELWGSPRRPSASASGSSQHRPGMKWWGGPGRA